MSSEQSVWEERLPCWSDRVRHVLSFIMDGWLTSDALKPATHHYLNLSSPCSREMQAEEWSESCTPASHTCLEAGLNQLEERHRSGMWLLFSATCQGLEREHLGSSQRWAVKGNLPLLQQEKIRIRESLRVEKTSKIILFNHKHSTDKFTTKPCP